MTNKAENKRGQSIFEYFILTIIVVSIALTFARNENYLKVNATVSEVFNQSVADITR